MENVDFATIRNWRGIFKRNLFLSSVLTQSGVRRYLMVYPVVAVIFTRSDRIET